MYVYRKQAIDTIKNYIKSSEIVAFHNVDGMGKEMITFEWDEEKDDVTIFIENMDDIDMSDDFWNDVDDMVGKEVQWHYLSDESLIDIVNIIKDTINKDKEF